MSGMFLKTTASPQSWNEYSVRRRMVDATASSIIPRAGDALEMSAVLRTRQGEEVLMDALDKTSVVAIIVLCVSSIVLISSHKGEARLDSNTIQRGFETVSSAHNGEFEAKVKQARNLQDSDNPAKAEGLLQELILNYPYEGEPHMMMGNILMKKQEPVKAMREYKEAIDLNPDYLDKKTPLFQGKKLKIAAGEAFVEIEKRIKADPKDEAAKNEKKTIYYLYRKIAGGCSG